MANDATNSDRPQMEDYGGEDDQESNKDSLADIGSQEKGAYSGGTTGTTQGSSEGEQAGDFGNTGTGTDLTMEMENTDVRSGLVKGGEQGADDVAGPGQYGGAAGNLHSSQDR